MFYSIPDFWGALMILFIYPFGKRFRKLAPKAHTLAEVIHARHGTSSQMIMAGSREIAFTSAPKFPRAWRRSVSFCSHM